MSRGLCQDEAFRCCRFCHVSIPEDRDGGGGMNSKGAAGTDRDEGYSLPEKTDWTVRGSPEAKGERGAHLRPENGT